MKEKAKKTADVTPIFILGQNRNGTTRLGNIIGTMKDVSGVLHELHYGSHEPVIFKKNRFYGDLRDPAKYKYFAEHYTKTDFFRITGLEADFFENTRYENFYEYFLDMMDEFARRRGCRHYVVKLDQTFAYYGKEYRKFRRILAQRYPEIEFICIKREYSGAAKSYLNLQGASRRRKNRFSKYFAVMFHSLLYSFTYRTFSKIIKQEKGMILDFCEIVKETGLIAEKIAVHLGIDTSNAEDAKKADSFVRNSSFTGNTAKVEISDGFLKFAQCLGKTAVKIFPAGVKAVIRFRLMFVKEEKVFYYRLMKQEDGEGGAPGNAKVGEGSAPDKVKDREGGARKESAKR